MGPKCKFFKQKKCYLVLWNVKFQWKTTTEVQVLRKHITAWPDLRCPKNVVSTLKISEVKYKSLESNKSVKMMLQEAYFEIFLRSDTRACPQRLASNRMDWPMQKTFPRISNNNINNNNKNNRNNNNNNSTHSRILKMGCLRIFISLRSIPF